MANPNIGEEGKATQFSSENQPANAGRKPSLKKQLAKVGLSDGWLTFPKKDVQFVTKKEKDKEGNAIEVEYVKIKVPKEEALALKLFQIGMSNKSNNIQAIKTYLETFDGKATQPISAKVEFGKPIADIPLIPEE